MIAEVVLAIFFLGATFALQPPQQNGVQYFAGAVKQALRKSQYGGSTSNCARNCSNSNLNSKFCDSICSFKQFNFKQLALLTEKCLSSPLCNIDLRNVPLTNVSLPFDNVNYNGRCFLVGGTASISFFNFSDNITPMNDILPQAVYVDDITIQLQWKGFNVTCIPCVPGATGTGFHLFDTVGCLANSITGLIGVDIFNCPSKASGYFTGHVEIAQKFIPRYTYVFSRSKNGKGQPFNRQATVNGGYSLIDVAATDWESTIPANNQTDIIIGLKDALSSEDLLQTLSLFFYDVYNSLYSFHVAPKCPVCK